MRIASWNVNSVRARLDHVRDWLAAERPDVLCLQETKVVDADFPAEAFTAAGYRAVISGQKSYNGVAVLARSDLALSDPVHGLPSFDDPQRRYLAVTVGDVRVVNVYVPNGSEVGSDKYAYKLDWLARLVDHLREAITHHPRLLLTGDFNIAPADIDVHDPEAWAGRILCSAPEREAFCTLESLGLIDLFRKLHPDDPGFSWWDYRMNAFRRDRGMRIDLALVTGELATAGRTCRVDRTPRGWERPSDHAPVVASFDLAD
ncbi:MAG: exodeoxyribonuclease III [Gammaproteobacteria bacterium]|nr:MAG: exodeoxyribonuclease III [Gammaproteobacteria bacterium]